MVATSQPLAVAAGLAVLAAGGNAADAAVATAAALNVTEPTSTGIGGDCFALYYEAATGCVTALNGSGRAPAALTLDRLAREGFGAELPPFHAHTVTVPGACAGWCDLVERHGRLAMSRILAPAIRLAVEGFPVAPITAHFWERGVERQLCNALGGLELTIDGRAPRAGEIFRNPGLARTLQIVAEGGKAAFYQGEIARDIAVAVRASGGVLDEQDLAEHRSTWEAPISTTYRGIRLWECPPNGQGLTALLALNILEAFDLRGLDPGEGERPLHRELCPKALRMRRGDMVGVGALTDALKERHCITASFDEKQRASLADVQTPPLRRKRLGSLIGERIERVKAHQRHLAERIDASDQRRVDHSRIQQARGRGEGLCARGARRRDHKRRTARPRKLAKNVENRSVGMVLENVVIVWE